MKTGIISGLCAALILAGGPVAAETEHTSKYSGEENREIKSLSSEDIQELRRGGGWGLAKAAELNGIPGPAHLLELQDEIPLTSEQVSLISDIYETMRARAVREGEILITLEQELETLFREDVLSRSNLKAKLDQIAQARGNLRFTHLATHLETPGLLSPAQITRYNELRGYAKSSCAEPPKGHDATLWRKHNGCP